MAAHPIYEGRARQRRVMAVAQNPAQSQEIRCGTHVSQILNFPFVALLLTL